MIVRRLARRRDVADPQLRLRGARPMYEQQPIGRRGGFRSAHRIGRETRSGRQRPARHALTRTERRRGVLHHLVMRQVADHDQRRLRRQVCPPVKLDDLRDRRRAKRVVGADGRVAVRMTAIEGLGEDPLGHRRREITQLNQASQPEITDAGELGRLEARPRHHVGQQRQAATGKPGQRDQTQDRGIRADLGTEPRADSGELVMDLGRRPTTAPFVEQVAGQGRQPRPVFRVGRRANRDQQHARHDRHRSVLDGPHLQTVRQRALPDLWEAESRVWPKTGSLRAVDRHHDTFTGVEWATANCGRPRGTTLSVTPRSRERYVDAVA